MPGASASATGPINRAIRSGILVSSPPPSTMPRRPRPATRAPPGTLNGKGAGTQKASASQIAGSVARPASKAGTSTSSKKRPRPFEEDEGYSSEDKFNSQGEIEEEDDADLFDGSGTEPEEDDDSDADIDADRAVLWGDDEEETVDPHVEDSSEEEEDEDEEVPSSSKKPKDIVRGLFDSRSPLPLTLSAETIDEWYGGPSPSL